MATRIENILTRARDTLADPDKERWTDDRLLRLVDEAQRDIAKQTQILKSDYTFVLEIGVAEYTLPDNVWLITRASTESYEIRLFSYDRMDEETRKIQLSRTYSDYQRERDHGYSTNVYPGRYIWETDTGSDIQRIIYDNRNINTIRVYPIPNEDIALNDYTFENAGPVTFVGDELYGCVTALTGSSSDEDYTFDSIYGCVTSLFDPQVTQESIDTYGVVTAIADSAKSVTLYYIRIPDTITSVDDVPETPPMFDEAIKHYIIANALRDDLDVQYRDMAAESMTLYNRELQVVQMTNSTDSTRNANNYTTTYRGGFE